MTVAFQGRHLPPSHGMSATPSGHLPSDLASPVGSFVAGNPALVRPRLMMYFVRRVWLCVPAQGCMTCHVSHPLGLLLHKGIREKHINRSPSAGLLQYELPHQTLTGSKRSQSPECGEATAFNLARW